MMAHLITGAGVLNAALTLLLAFILQSIGAAIGGKERVKEADLLTGWSGACIVYFCAGILTSLSFAWINIAFSALAAIAVFTLYRQQSGFCPESSSRLLLLSLPFIAVISSMQPNMWDELSHWLPNAKYLIDYQHFPGKEGYPASTSAHAGYPYGLPLIIYAVESMARLLGSTIWNTGTAPVFNVLLLIAAAGMVLQIIHRERPDWQFSSLQRWALSALALMLVTILCPGFVDHIVLSAYSDNATTVAFLAIGLWLVFYCSGTQHNLPRSSIRLQLALLLVLIACLKEDNALPALLMVAGAGLWQWRAGRNFWELVGELALVCLPMIAVILLWHGYSASHIPQGEMGIRPRAEWHPELASAIAKGFWSTALHKSGYFLCALVITGIALYRWIKKPQADDRLGMLALITTCAFLGYNAFLAFAYISIFSVEEARRVASLWRYNTHFSLLQVAVIIMLLVKSRRIPSIPNGLCIIAIALVVVAPVPLASKLRSDMTDFMVAARTMGQDIQSLTDGKGKVLLINMKLNGMDCTMIKFQLKDGNRVTNCINILSGTGDFAGAFKEVRYVWSNGWPDFAAKATGLTLSADEAHLIQRNTDGNWQPIKAWPELPDGK